MNNFKKYNLKLISEESKKLKCEILGFKGNQLFGYVEVVFNPGESHSRSYLIGVYWDTYSLKCKSRHPDFEAEMLGIFDLELKDKNRLITPPKNETIIDYKKTNEGVLIPLSKNINNEDFQILGKVGEQLFGYVFDEDKYVAVSWYDNYVCHTYTCMIVPSYQLEFVTNEQIESEKWYNSSKFPILVNLIEDKNIQTLVYEVNFNNGFMMDGLGNIINKDRTCFNDWEKSV